MKTLVRTTLADSAITSAQKRKLAALAARPEAEIDFSDIPRFLRLSGRTQFGIPTG